MLNTPASRFSLLLLLATACGDGVDVDVVAGDAVEQAISAETPTCVTLTPGNTAVEDSTLDRSSARGAALTLESDAARRMALQFDLSTLAGARVSSANLVLTCRDKGKVAAPRRPANVRAITRPWTESTVTQTSIQSAINLVPSGTIPFGVTGGALATQRSSDLKALVASWLDNPASNNGVAIDEDNPRGTSCQSSEASSGQPALEVCFTHFRSCSELRAAQPSAPSGTYRIDTDGAGPNAPITVECDMSHDGGGWTLVMATRGTGPIFLSGPNSSTTTPSALSLNDAVALANISQQVHIRTAGVPSDSVTTRPGTTPIQNLRIGRMLYTSVAQARVATDFFGARLAEVGVGCQQANVGYPSIYHACDNAAGLHLITDTSKWAVFLGPSDPLEVWVRDAAIPATCAEVFTDLSAPDGEYFLSSGGYTNCVRRLRG